MMQLFLVQGNELVFARAKAYLRGMLEDMNYTLSNSKYIQLSTHLSYADIWWQSVILLRGLLDQKLQTDSQRMSINFNVNGSTDLSVFDAVLCLVIIMNHQMGFRGDMYYSNIDKLFDGLYEDLTPKPLIDGNTFKIASFNFDVKKMTDPDWYSTIENQTILGIKFYSAKLSIYLMPSHYHRH